MLDFPGTTSECKSIGDKFLELSGMAGIVIFLARYDGSPNSHIIEEYGRVKAFAGNAPMLVCLTQVGAAISLGHTLIIMTKTILLITH